MKRFIIEREIPGVDNMTQAELAAASAKSNRTLEELAGRVQWIQSFIAAGKTYCLYMATDEGAVREHARRSEFPANKIVEITGAFDPMTADRK